MAESQKQRAAHCARVLSRTRTQQVLTLLECAAMSQLWRISFCAIDADLSTKWYRDRSLLRQKYRVFPATAYQTQVSRRCADIWCGTAETRRSRPLKTRRSHFKTFQLFVSLERFGAKSSRRLEKLSIKVLPSRMRYGVAVAHSFYASGWARSAYCTSRRNNPCGGAVWPWYGPGCARISSRRSTSRCPRAMSTKVPVRLRIIL